MLHRCHYLSYTLQKLHVASEIEMEMADADIWQVDSNIPAGQEEQRDTANEIPK